jgi:carboxyl-terminal processing protease
MRILVAGEQRELGEFLLPFLARKGYTLSFVRSADEFIERVEAESFDLIIMDLDLSAEDGFTTSEELNGDLRAISTPVIAVADSTRLVPCLKGLGQLLKHNAAAVLDKPVDLRELDREMARVFGARTLKAGCLTDDTLGRLADGELPEGETKLAQRHLAQCQFCQQRYDVAKRTDLVLRESFSTGVETAMESSEECISPSKLTAYFRDGLSALERKEVETHLARCSYCTRELVSLYKLMKEYDEKQTEQLGEDVLHRLKVGMKELLDKAKGPLICVHCFGSIPLENESCPQCGAWVKGRAQGDSAANARDERDKESGEPRSDQGYLGARRVQVAGSLFALLVIGSIVLLGLTSYQNYKFNVIAKPAINKVNTLLSAGAETILAEHIQKNVEEEIEVFGRVAMYESRPTRLEVPLDVARIARMVVDEYYHDQTVAEKALRHGDIWDAFRVLNRSENRGSRSPLLPKYPNRILNPDEMQLLKGEMSGSYTGIGLFARRARWGNGDEIIDFSPDSTAEKAGLKIGDVITEVDGRSLRGLDLHQKASLVRGPAGTRAKLRVKRQGVPDFQVWVSREKTIVPSVGYRAVGKDTGYVSVEGLAEWVPAQLNKALDEFNESHVRKLVLDLRGNTGGSLQTAADVVGLFLPEQTLMTRIGYNEGQRECYAKGGCCWDGLLAVLVDGETMSGAELIAAALQGTDRAVIVGERTAGKGSVQTVYRLGGGYGIQLTTGVLAAPDGTVFNNRGVEPDVEVSARKRVYFPNQPVKERAMDRVVRVAVERLEEVAFSTSGKGRIRDGRRTGQGGEVTSENFVG